MLDGALPTTWAKDKNVVWKREIAGNGWSSPVVTGGRVYLTTAVPDQMKAPGTWMHDALEVRDQWTSRLLRTSAWSPPA